MRALWPPTARRDPRPTMGRGSHRTGGTRSLRLLCDRAFAAGLDRLTAVIEVGNVPAWRSVESCGFVRQRIRQGHYLYRKVL
jgi:RimJ/RimL family protein N-acetyltransferase